MANDSSSTHGSRVAFTAKLSVDDSYPKHSGVLKFANVLLNEGGGYDPTTGVFVCPASGLYHFAVQVTVYGRGQCAIFKNGERVVSLCHANQPDRLSFNSSQVAGTSCVVRLRGGDHVWVDLWGQGQSDIFATEDNDTIFTGFCLM